MYEYIKGQVTFVSPYYIVVEANGIGYQVAVANPFMYRVDETVVNVYLQQVVREDSQILYGFSSIQEKQLFIKLNSVSGIGPKSALAIMASDDHGGLVSAVESADSTFLTKFPGVGKKTAQQMILDLKGKLTDIGIEAGGRQTSLDIDSAPVSSSDNLLLDEASEALQALGYSAKEVKRVSKELAKVEATTTDEYLRQGLKLMMKK